MSTNIRKNTGKLLNLHQNLTKVESRRDSTNHASMLVLAAPRIRIVYEENVFYYSNCGHDDDGSHSSLCSGREWISKV